MTNTTRVGQLTFKNTAMLQKMLLINRSYQVDGNWFAPEEFLKKFKSVVASELVYTSSSAGDWTGYFVQKLQKNYFLILFSQENRFPRSGFNLYTGSIVAKSKTNFTESEIYSIIQ